MVNDQVTKRYITPLIEPTVRAAEGWLATLVLGAVNAGHIWFFAGVFTMFPAALKRLAVVGVGTAYPVAATMVAASTGDTVAGRSRVLEKYTYENNAIRFSEIYKRII